MQGNQASKTAQIKFLDGMRGLAALYVMIGHARYLLWEGYGAYKEHPAAYTATGKLLLYFFSLFRYGHEAVMFFFVLSGFVIHLKYARRISKDPNTGFGYRDYLGRRAARLYPPVIFALLLTLVLDSYGSYVGLNVYSGATPYAAINAVNKDRSAMTFIGNLFWLQRTVVPEFGSNGPLWSLMYEWWFYMIYPAFFYLNRKNMAISALVVVLLCAASFRLPYIQLLTPVLQAFVLWYLGVVIADIYAGRIALAAWWPAAFVVLVPFVMLRGEKIGPGFLPDLLMAMGFASLLYTMQLLFKKGHSFNMLNRLRWLGECSYSLYVIHFPVLFFGSGLLMKKYGGQLPVSQAYIFAGIVLTVAFAWAVHFLIEKPFTQKKPVLQTRPVNTVV